MERRGAPIMLTGLASVLITTLTGCDQSISFVLDRVLFFFPLPKTEQVFCLISFFPCKSNLEENFTPNLGYCPSPNSCWRIYLSLCWFFLLIHSSVIRRVRLCCCLMFPYVKLHKLAHEIERSFNVFTSHLQFLVLFFLIVFSF